MGIVMYGCLSLMLLQQQTANFHDCLRRRFLRLKTSNVKLLAVNYKYLFYSSTGGGKSHGRNGVNGVLRCGMVW